MLGARACLQGLGSPIPASHWGFCQSKINNLRVNLFSSLHQNANLGCILIGQVGQLGDWPTNSKNQKVSSRRGRRSDNSRMGGPRTCELGRGTHAGVVSIMSSIVPAAAARAVSLLMSTKSTAAHSKQHLLCPRPSDDDPLRPVAQGDCVVWAERS